MHDEGPPLADMMRRLADAPPELHRPLAGMPNGVIRIDAVLCDLLRLIVGRPAETVEHRGVKAASTPAVLNYHRTILTVCWLLADDWFRDRAPLSQPILDFIVDHLPAIASAVPAREWTRNDLRREELVRVTLASIGLRPAGESIAMAEDRLAAVDTLGRLKVLRESADAIRRIIEVRRAMAEKKAREAANVYSRE